MDKPSAEVMRAYETAQNLKKVEHPIYYGLVALANELRDERAKRLELEHEKFCNHPYRHLEYKGENTIMKQDVKCCVLEKIDYQALAHRQFMGEET